MDGIFMLRYFRLKNLVFSLLCGGIVLGITGGCISDPAALSKEADEQVYNIIEKKWRARFGYQANYRISDVAASPNDIKIKPSDIDPCEPITLVKAVAIATANNRDYQTQKEELYIVALDLTSRRHDFERQWFATFDSSYNRDAANERITYEPEFGFRQLLAEGTEISASIALDWIRFLTGDPSMSLGSVLAATIRQPLLRGANRDIVLENLTQAERNVLYQIRNFSRFRKSFVVSIVDDYYRILQLKDRVTNADNNYKRRLQSKERLEMEADAGRRNRFEVDQAATDVLRAKDSYVRNQQAYEQALDQFKIRLSLPTDLDVGLDDKELSALANMEIVPPEYVLASAVEAGLIGRLDLATTKDRIDDAQRKINVAADNLGIKLDIVGSANVGSGGKSDFTNLQFHNGTYQLGLDVELPLDQLDDRNTFRKAVISLTRQKREYDNERAEVKLDIRQAYRQLISAAERYVIQKNSLALAESRVESTTLLLEAGRSKTRDLLESQDALLESQNAVTAALVDHTIAKLNFFRDIGILQVKPDGMWIQ